MYFNGTGNDLLSACSGFNMMTINEFSCNSPEVKLPHHPALSLLEVGLENAIHLIFLEEFLVLLLVPDNPGLRWMVSDAVLSQRKVLTVPSATRNMKVSTSLRR